MILITIDSQPVIEALQRLGNNCTPDGMRPLMKEIGEVLSDSTKTRFQASIAPDGSPWEPIAQLTALNRLRKGRPGTKPLIDSGELSRFIHHQIFDGGTGVVVGTDRSFGAYDASVHQFGATKAGKNRNVTIPARPFLGLSSSDEQTVLDLINKHLAP